MSPGFSLVTCKKCGWVHFEVSRQYAEFEVKKFSEHYNSLTAEQKEDYYGSKGVSIKDYESCSSCSGPYKKFRKTKDGDCPDGCNISPIINRKE